MPVDSEGPTRSEHVVLSLTPGGREEVETPRLGLSLPQRWLLLRVDGRSSLAHIAQASDKPLQLGRLPLDAARLLQAGLVVAVEGEASEGGPMPAGPSPTAARPGLLAAQPVATGGGARAAAPSGVGRAAVAGALVVVAGLAIYALWPRQAPEAARPSDAVAVIAEVPASGIEPPERAQPRSWRPWVPPPPEAPVSQGPLPPPVKAPAAPWPAAPAPVSPRDGAVVQTPPPAAASAVPVPLPASRDEVPLASITAPAAASRPASAVLAARLPTVTRAAPPAAAPLVPLVSPMPDYPRELLRDDPQEFVLRARLALSASGEVTEVRFVGEPSRNSRAFERSARATLQQWRFAPGAAGRQYSLEVVFRVE